MLKDCMTKIGNQNKYIFKQTSKTYDTHVCLDYSWIKMTLNIQHAIILIQKWISQPKSFKKYTRFMMKRGITEFQQFK